MAEAEMAVRNIGTNGIPFLLQWINYEPPTWRKKLRSNLPDRLANSPQLHGLLMVLRIQSPASQFMALEYLERTLLQ